MNTTPRTFFVADPHLGHKKLAEVRGFDTVEDFAEHFVLTWNHFVTPQDKVYVLGDFCWNAGALVYVPRLNGRINLVLGNHDTLETRKYLEAGVRKVYGAVEFRGGLLTHVPVHPRELTRYAFNVHGHLHDEVVRDRSGESDERYVCVSWEQNERPVTWGEIVLCNERVMNAERARDADEAVG